ncbi:class I SAM-dependent RNA methyltransferase [Ornithinimicrobium panacihumi]|uniref:class I SAM-dependent RNA methyltransferase n=1 Tax=Ornithinimicrobium panacihumi TaxID=2008449 RepID=UPI003F899662
MTSSDPTSQNASSAGTSSQSLAVGDEVTVEVGPVAHGGHCVARHEGDGIVLFVRHCLPGETVRARVTEVGSGARFVRADAVEILDASPDRVSAPCPFSGPGRCGGCDWQHASLDAQRRLKLDVVAEQFQRLAGMRLSDTFPHLTCEPVPGDRDGLRWRTRVEATVVGAAVEGRTGLRAHRSHEVVPVDDCLIAHEGVLATGIFHDGPGDPAVVALDAVAPSVGEPVLVPLTAPPAPARRPGRRGSRDGRRESARRGERHTPVPLDAVPVVTERVGAHEFTLSARGFWQVHPGAATTFTEQVLAWLDPQVGESALDLYAGVGLFAVPLAERVGESGRVLAVEADREAAAAAERHLQPWTTAGVWAEPTERALAELTAQGEHADLVVLDPPRSGAGRAVMESIAALSPRAVVYVACDPAALARDVATARDLGLELVELRVLDAFPMTHHMECLALLRPRA